jgi:DNA-binding beta-propeller fold protein YncE
MRPIVPASIFIFATLAVLNGSAQAHSPAAPVLATAARARGWLLPGALQQPRLYVAADSGEVVIYPVVGNNPKPIGTIRDGITNAFGVFVDSQGMLYVANQTGSPASVVVYPPGSVTPSLTITQGLSRPLFPTVDRSGNLFVSDANTGQVVEYLAGQTTPYRFLQTPGVEAHGLAFSRSGDLYVAYRPEASADSGIVVFKHGRGMPHDLGIKLNAPEGLTVDPQGDIVVSETNGTNRVDVFPPGATTPSKTWNIRHIPTGVALDRDADALFVPTLLNGLIFHVRYQTGSHAFLRIRMRHGSFEGIAVYPPERI